MNLKHLNDDELLASTEHAAREEREATTKLLHHLCEVQERRLFCKLSYASLFEYCVSHLKMSESQASRRLNAARLLREIPEVENKINEGELNLTAVSQAQVLFKKEAKKKTPFSKDKKKEVLSALENRSTREAEKILFTYSSEEVEVPKEEMKLISESLIQMKANLDSEAKEAIERLKEVWSHSMPNPTNGELIKKMALFCLENLDPIKKAKRSQERNRLRVKENRVEKVKETAAVSEQRATKYQRVAGEERRNNSSVKGDHPEYCEATPAPALNQTDGFTADGDEPFALFYERLKFPEFYEMIDSAMKRTRYIPVHVKSQVILRDQSRCTFFDPITKRRCYSRHQIEFDHVVPYCNGGENTVDNLRLRCRAHNTWHAMQSLGSKALRYQKFH